VRSNAWDAAATRIEGEIVRVYNVAETLADLTVAGIASRAVTHRVPPRNGGSVPRKPEDARVMVHTASVN